MVRGLYYAVKTFDFSQPGDEFYKTISKFILRYNGHKYFRYYDRNEDEMEHEYGENEGYVRYSYEYRIPRNVLKLFVSMDIPEESEYLNITGIAYKGIFDVNYVTFSDSDGTEQIENDDIRYQRDINGHYFVNNLLEGIIQQYEDITDIYFSFEIV